MAEATGKAAADVKAADVPPEAPPPIATDATDVVTDVAPFADADSSPPWPVHRDQSAQADAARDAARQEARALQEGVKGDTYTFHGHKDEGNGTVLIHTEYGDVRKGGVITLPEETVTSLRKAGWKFTKKSEG